MIDLKAFEDYLKSTVARPKSKNKSFNRLSESMNYSLLADGKRIRPQLFLSIIADNKKDQKLFLSFAAALEMIHCYSLIHDDLPALDNDDYRRGKPSNHKLFGEATAILAGDALLTLSFEQASKRLPISAINQIIMINTISQHIGYQELILGQDLDIAIAKNNSKKNKEIIEFIYAKKTGSLFLAAILSAAIACNVKKELPKFKRIATNLGIYYQLYDDISEYVAGGLETLNNYIAIYSLKKAQAKLQSLESEIRFTLRQISDKYETFKSTIEYMLSLMGKVNVQYESKKK